MTLFSILSPQDLMLAMAIAFAAGWIKGIVGFAMPMVMVSGLNFFLTPELTLAGLILPTLVTNGLQALRGGAVAAYSSVLNFRVFLIVGGLMLVLSAQLVTMVPSSVSLLLIGGLVSVFCLFQVLGVRLVLNQPSPRIEAAMRG